ncbi:MAG: hypothetical protein LBM77_04695 [Spirochaetaceae bacterium]|jgi:hypothetical protein|nr:hypothetical protein [Spirochaetaceae bacterium]
MKERNEFLLVFLYIYTMMISAQEQTDDSRPTHATWTDNTHSAMLIAGHTYKVCNANSPIAPRGGEMVIDFAGALPYYMWVYSLVTHDWAKETEETANDTDNVSGANFAIARIDMNLKIYYNDTKTDKFIAPDGAVLNE